MAFGRHLIADLYFCEVAFLDDPTALADEMIKAAETAGAKVRQSVFDHFLPYGVTGIIIIAESHLAIHTYPELSYVALDVFTCGRTVDPQVICELLVSSLQPRVVATECVLRGQHLSSD